MSVDKVDLEARRRAARILHEKFGALLEKVMRGEPPVLEIPKRTLANVRFDRERGILVMGEDTASREMLNMGETRRFMQTLLMAAIIYQALVENEYPTIRDLYYRGKHTIVYRDLKGRLREENTWDEQRESDAAIQDVEVYTGLLREEMLILSKEKGKVVGRMVIRSGGDTIDLSRMGHGAYAIESTPDLIEFVNVDAEFVLVVEKDAVFQQLHRYKFWDKYRAILVTGAGQPDRATRRFVRRLNTELGLPVYVLTDSIPADETVIVRAPGAGVMVGPVEELLEEYFTGLDRERVEAPLEVPSVDPGTGRIRWARVGYIYRHRVRTRLVEIETEGRGLVRVTGGHSLFVYRDGGIHVVPASKVRPGDMLLAAARLPGTADAGLPGLPRSGLVKARSDAGAKGLFAALLMSGLDARVEEWEGPVEIALDAPPGRRFLGDTVLVRVGRVGLEPYEGYVYDFMVPGTNSFIGGYGIVYHNSDPYGWYIYSVYKVGSINLSYESERLATPKARFLGVSMSDVFGIPGRKQAWLSERERKNFIIRATERDLKRAAELERYSWFQTPKWRLELKLFKEKKAKLEIEAMASKGLRFLADTYLPRKIETGDWID